jgi:hypothetical protein
MLSKIVASLAVIGSAAAYAPTMNAMGRREVLKTAAAGAVVAPLLRPSEAEAGSGTVGGNSARWVWKECLLFISVCPPCSVCMEDPADSDLFTHSRPTATHEMPSLTQAWKA